MNTKWNKLIYFVALAISTVDFSSTAAPSIPEYRTANLTSVVSGTGNDATEQSKFIRHCTINVFICVLYTNKEKNMFKIVQVQIFNLCLSHIVHITPLVLGTVEVENCLFFSFSTLPTAMLLWLSLWPLISHFRLYHSVFYPFICPSLCLYIGLYLSTVLSQCKCLLLFSEWWLEFLAGLGSLVDLW